MTTAFHFFLACSLSDQVLFMQLMNYFQNAVTLTVDASLVTDVVTQVLLGTLLQLIFQDLP